MRRPFWIILCLTLSPAALAQTLTIPDPDGSGNTIVEVITIDPIAGLATTSIIETIPAGEVPTTAAATNTATAATAVDTEGPPPQQGPVGAPPTTPSGTAPPIYTFTYTTIDADGDTLRFTQQFVPTYQTPNPTTPLTAGTVWALSEYTQQFGSNLATIKSSARSLHATWISPVVGIACTALGMVAGGFVAIPWGLRQR